MMGYRYFVGRHPSLKAGACKSGLIPHPLGCGLGDNLSDESL